MAFSDIPKIEDYQWYLDLAFSRAKKASSEAKNVTRGPRVDKVRAGELARVREIRRVLLRHFDLVLRSFPSIDSLTEFYNELVRATVDYADLKKSLGSINWAKIKVEGFSTDYGKKIAKTQHLRKLSDYSSEYYGRVSSVLKQVRKALKFLEQARLVMRDYPSIKGGLFTVCIAGFPNVGKTTLLTKLTASRPEIANYAFTTKKLNVGYLLLKDSKVQMIDTPGTLNRFEKMNSVEQMAHLAMKYCADMIVFVIDVSGVTYELETQKKLLREVKKFGKPIVVYASKVDLLTGKNPVNDSLTTAKEVKEFVEKAIRNEVHTPILRLGL